MARVTFYKSLYKLNILRFLEIAKTSNYCLLDVEHNDYRVYSKSQKNRALEQWMMMYDEYFIVRDDSDSKQELVKMFERDALKGKIGLLGNVIKAMESLKKTEHILPRMEVHELKEQFLTEVTKHVNSKVIIARLQPTELIIEDLCRMRMGLQNTFNLYYKSKETVFEDQVDNVYRVMAHINQWIDGILPRPDQMCVMEFLEYERICLKRQAAANLAENGNRQ